MIIRILKKIKRKLFSNKPDLSTNEKRIAHARKLGVKIGKDCLLYEAYFSTEPYLIEIGDHVAVSPYVVFNTHDGSAFTLRQQYPDLTVYGRTKIGNNVFIGAQCIFLPNTEVGDNCIIGAGSVVRGKIPENSVVFGNPAQVVMKTDLFQKMLLNNKGRVDTKNMTAKEREVILRKHFNIPD
jgi:acetyltransferase-like isoleucine patch superfamily enzyme